MLRRPVKNRTQGPRRAAIVVLVASAVIGASCSGGDRAAITKNEPSAVALTTSTTAPPVSTEPASTEPAPTEPAPTEPAPTVPAPPETSAPPLGTPDEHQGDGAPTSGPPPEVVRPPAAWIGFGVPQPGSMFENLQADRSLDGKGKFVAFTFDDGPSQYTQPIVDILRFMGVQGTFFQIAKQSLAQQEFVKRMLFSGMHIGSHSQNHPHLREVTPEQQQEEVWGSIDRMNEAFGPGTIKCFRPPYAQYDQRVLDMVGQRGMATAMWSFDTLDWKKPAWQSLVNRIVNGAQDRQVLLFHDGGGDRTQTILALPWIIQGLRDKGFQFIPVC